MVMKEASQPSMEDSLAEHRAPLDMSPKSADGTWTLAEDLWIGLGHIALKAVGLVQFLLRLVQLRVGLLVVALQELFETIAKPVAHKISMSGERSSAFREVGVGEDLWERRLSQRAKTGL